jgi:hypothetical protein
MDPKRTSGLVRHAAEELARSCKSSSAPREFVSQNTCIGQCQRASVAYEFSQGRKVVALRLGVQFAFDGLPRPVCSIFAIRTQDQV